MSSAGRRAAHYAQQFWKNHGRPITNTSVGGYATLHAWSKYGNKGGGNQGDKPSQSGQNGKIKPKDKPETQNGSAGKK